MSEPADECHFYRAKGFQDATCLRLTALRARIATLKAQVEQAREALEFVCNHGICGGITCTDEEYGNGDNCEECGLLLEQKCCRYCPVKTALQALREGGKNA